MAKAGGPFTVLKFLFVTLLAVCAGTPVLARRTLETPQTVGDVAVDVAVPQAGSSSLAQTPAAGSAAPAAESRTNTGALSVIKVTCRAVCRSASTYVCRLGGSVNSQDSGCCMRTYALAGG
jgi:hypothetical protein